MPTQTDNRLLRVKEVADVMRVSTMTVYRLIHAGDIQATRVGHSYRIAAQEVDAYLMRRIA